MKLVIIPFIVLNLHFTEYFGRLAENLFIPTFSFYMFIMNNKYYLE